MGFGSSSPGLMKGLTVACTTGKLKQARGPPQQMCPVLPTQAATHLKRAPGLGRGAVTSTGPEAAWMSQLPLIQQVRKFHG